MTVHKPLPLVGYFGQYLDMEVTAKNELDLIRRYREIALHPECDMQLKILSMKQLSLMKMNNRVTVDHYISYLNGKELKER
jgi:hypothetical protein